MKKRKRQQQKVNWIAGLIFLVALGIFYSVQEQRFIRQSLVYDIISGNTMGTVYEVKLSYSGITEAGLAELEKAVADVLDEVEGRMSIYISDSEISRFNQAPAGEPFAVSDSLLFVVKQSLRLAEITQGAFDPTVAPLVNLWGFGRDGRRDSAPSDDAIDAAMALVGWDKLTIENGSSLVKAVDGLELDLGAVAKGYAVDRVVELLRSRRIQDFMVEIGGDIYVSGLNSAEDLWRIGIDVPEIAAVPGQRLRGIVNVTDMAIATSGGYRNYIKGSEGRAYSHIIDPQTGRASPAPRASITVVAETCLVADALATALYVLGEDRGIELIESIDGAEALFIVMEGEDRVRDAASSGFHERTSYIRVR